MRLLYVRSYALRQMPKGAFIWSWCPSPWHLSAASIVQRKNATRMPAISVLISFVLRCSHALHQRPVQFGSWRRLSGRARSTATAQLATDRCSDADRRLAGRGQQPRAPWHALGPRAAPDGAEPAETAPAATSTRSQGQFA